MQIDYGNFECEDCGNDKFTIINDFSGRSDITLHCSNKDCEASYTFSPEMKMRMSCHPPKRCSCGVSLLSRDDNYCGNCGKKNTYFKCYRKQETQVKK